MFFFSINCYSCSPLFVFFVPAHVNAIKCIICRNASAHLIFGMSSITKIWDMVICSYTIFMIIERFIFGLCRKASTTSLWTLVVVCTLSLCWLTIKYPLLSNLYFKNVHYIRFLVSRVMKSYSYRILQHFSRIQLHHLLSNIYCHYFHCYHPYRFHYIRVPDRKYW